MTDPNKHQNPNPNDKNKMPKPDSNVGTTRQPQSGRQPSKIDGDNDDDQDLNDAREPAMPSPERTGNKPSPQKR